MTTNVLSYAPIRKIETRMKRVKLTACKREVRHAKKFLVRILWVFWVLWVLLSITLKMYNKEVLLENIG
jgi:hypothetical protein